MAILRMTRRRMLRGAALTGLGLTGGTFGSVLSSGIAAGQERQGTRGRPALAIREQGSFYVGGKQTRNGTNAAPFDPSKAVLPSQGNETIWVSDLYAQYQVPTNPRPLPIVLWHGGGLNAKCWEQTADGREGYQSILLRDRYSVYIIDQPGQGRTSRGVTAGLPGAAGLRTGVEGAWTRDRLGPAPGQFFPNTAFPRDAVDQYFHQMGSGGGGATRDDTVAAVAALFDRIGPGILVTHSASALTGWFAAMTTSKIRAVIAYEPASQLYPQGQVPNIPTMTNGDKIFAPTEVPLEQFRKLAAIPIQIVYGDNIPSAPTPRTWFMDWWRVNRMATSLQVDAIRRLGGDVTLLNLPEAGLTGNTHFPFSDLNNEGVANTFFGFLRSKRLD